MKFDLSIIGGGPGGYYAAIRASQFGKKVCLIDKDNLGGICLNWGCIPTKTLLKNAEVYNYIKNSRKYGINVEKISLDTIKNIKRSREVSKRLSKGIEYLIKKNNIFRMKGDARLKNKNEIMVNSNGNSNLIESDYIILATGARPKTFPSFSMDNKRIISSKEAMLLEQIPKKIVIIGSGAIGCEFSYYFNEFGAEVHLIESEDIILPLEDLDISKELEKNFIKSGIQIHKNSKVLKINSLKSEVKVTYLEDSNQKVLKGDYALVAVGVTGNVENIGLEKLGIKVANGAVKINEYNQTNIENIYAIGDVSGPPWLAHVASAQGNLAVEHAFEKGSRPIDYLNIPGCTYCQPQVASLGLTEKEALRRGHEVKIGKYSFMANGKALAVGHNEGFVKLIFDQKYGELIGAHIIGQNATELISELSIAISLETTWEQLAFGIHPHPTFSEGIMEAAMDAYGIGVHQ